MCKNTLPSLHQRRSRPAFSHGYTLVELSIVIIIVGLLTAGGLAVGASMVERAAYIDTRKLIDQLHQTLKDHYIVTGRLPCAARMDLAPGNVNFGAEVNCAAAVAGTWRDGGVRIGAVPTRALGLPDSAAGDKFGNRFVYAVTEGLTSAATFGSTPGAITVRDMNNNTILTDAAFFIASPGRDRKGAYIHNTGATGDACSPAANLDTLNCTLTSAIFRDAPFNNGDVAARFFDDVTAWAPKFHFMSYDTQSSALWALQSGTQHIFSIGTDNNTASTNVGIGTTAPATKLHVVGNAAGLRLQGTNHIFTEFYAKGATPRSGIIGYPNATSNDLTIQNQITGGHINLQPTATGNVGVGTTAPQAKIHTTGNIRTDARELRFGANQSITGSGTTTFYMNSSSTAGYLYMRDNANANMAAFFGTAASGGMIVGTSTRLSFSRTGSDSSYIYGGPTNNQRLVLIGANTFTEGAFMYLHGRNLESGAVALVAATNSTGATTTHSFGRYPSSGGPTYHSMAHLLANGNLALQGSVIALSDERAKKDITPLENALERLAEIRGVTYRWNGEGHHEDTTTKHIGVIAQDVQKVFPEAIAETPNSSMLSVQYNALIPPLIEAVKQLKAENDALKETVASLRTDNPEASTTPAAPAPHSGLRGLDIVLLLGLGGLAVYALRQRRT